MTEPATCKDCGQYTCICAQMDKAIRIIRSTPVKREPVRTVRDVANEQPKK